jgi:hypothetical protein
MRDDMKPTYLPAAAPLLLALTACALPLAAAAGDLTEKTSTIAPTTNGQNYVYIRLTGTPGNANPSGSPSGSCSNLFAVALMTDSNFKSFIYPLILMAQTADAAITLRTNGCVEGTYPLIVGVDYPPR